MTSDDGNVPWTLKQIKEYFKEYSNSYDKDINLKSYPAPYIISSWIQQEQYISALKQVKLMDLGCGTGVSSKLFLNDERYAVHGIDATLEMIEKAQKLPFKSLNCQNLEETLHESSESFDAVVCVGVFDFIVNRKRVLKEIARLLKKGGVAGITIPEPTASKENIDEFWNQSNLKIIKTDQFFGYRDSQNGQVVNFLGFLLKKT